METVQAITISITIGDIATAIAPDQAISNIFADFVKRIDKGGIRNLPTYIRDVNGNSIGNIIVR